MRLLVCAVLFAATAVWAQEGTAGQGVNLYSIPKEVALGAQLAQEFRQKTTPIDSAAVRGFVEGIGRRLSAPLLNPGFQYTFGVVADSLGGQTHVASSLPAGYVFVPAGLILAARDDAEFAGMLAHAMAHIAERHGTRQATRVELARFQGLPLLFMGGWTGTCAGNGVGAVPQSLLHFQRKYETEADVLAIKTMSAAGYDPEALLRYIARTQADDATVSKANSGFPPRDARIAGLKETIQGLELRTYTPTNELPAIQNEVRRLLTDKEPPRGSNLLR